MADIKPGDMLRHPAHPNDRLEVWQVDDGLVHASSRWNTVVAPPAEFESWFRAAPDPLIDILTRVAVALGRALHEDDDAEAFWSVCAELEKEFPQMISWHNSMTDGGSKTKPMSKQ